MNKENKQLDEDIKKRFATEEKYKAKVPPKKKQRTGLIVAGIIMFLVLLINIIVTLLRYL